MKTKFLSCAIGVLCLLISGFFVSVQAQINVIGPPPQEVFVHCPPAEVLLQKQSGLSRGTSEYATWEFRIVPVGDVKVWNQVWKYPGQGYADVTGGTWTVDANDPNLLTWVGDADLAVGKFDVSFKANRDCGVGGGGKPDEIEASWSGDVVGKGAYRSTWTTTKDGVQTFEGRINLYGEPGFSGTTPANGAKVFQGQDITLQLAFQDPDQHKSEGETEWKDFAVPVSWANYNIAVSLINAEFKAGGQNISQTAAVGAPGIFGLTNLELKVDSDIPAGQDVQVIVYIQDNTKIPEHYVQTGTVDDLSDGTTPIILTWQKATVFPETVETVWQSPPGASLGKAGVGEIVEQAGDFDVVLVENKYGPDANGAATEANYEGVAVHEIFPAQDVATNIISDWIKPNVLQAYPGLTPAQILSKKLNQVKTSSTFSISSQDTTADSFEGGYGLLEEILTTAALQQPGLNFERTQ